jgi:hypothetical protein
LQIINCLQSEYEPSNSSKVWSILVS